MLWRIRELMDGAGDLLRAEIDLAAQRMRQGVAAGILLAAAIGVGLLGLAGVLAGVTIAVADAIGWVGGLLAVGLLLLAVGVVAAWPIVSRLNAATEPAPNPRRRAAASKRQMSDAVDLSVSKDEAKRRSGPPGREGRGGPDRSDQGKSGRERPGAEPGEPSDSPVHAAAEFAARHPMAVAGGAILVLSAVGPHRTFRLVSRGMALASLASTVIDAMKDEAPEHAANGRAGPGPVQGREQARRQERSAAGSDERAPSAAVEPKPHARPPRFQVD